MLTSPPRVPDSRSVREKEHIQCRQTNKTVECSNMSCRERELLDEAKEPLTKREKPLAEAFLQERSRAGWLARILFDCYGLEALLLC